MPAEAIRMTSSACPPCVLGVRSASLLSFEAIPTPLVSGGGVIISYGYGTKGRIWTTLDTTLVWPGTYVHYIGFDYAATTSGCRLPSASSLVLPTALSTLVYPLYDEKPTDLINLLNNQSYLAAQVGNFPLQSCDFIYKVSLFTRLLNPFTVYYPDSVITNTASAIVTAVTVASSVASDRASSVASSAAIVVDRGGMSIGGVVGIAVAAVFVVLVGLALILRRRKRTPVSVELDGSGVEKSEIDSKAIYEIGTVELAEADPDAQSPAEMKSPHAVHEIG